MNNSCSYSNNKQNILKRLRKIEGQVKGIHRMVEDEKYCVDILIQIAAARAALNRVGLIILEDHVRGCVTKSIESEDSEDLITELVDIIFKFIK